MTMKDIIICDLDGTIADIKHRRHFVELPVCSQCHGYGTVLSHVKDALYGHRGAGKFVDERCPMCTGKKRIGKQDWAAFHAACVDDTPLTTTIDLVEALVVGMGEALHPKDIWIVSGRSDSVEKETVEWLSRHIHYDKLIMRKAGDYTPDDQLKKSWLDSGLIPKERVFCVFDDRDRVVKMWREEGLICYQVAPGNF